MSNPLDCRPKTPQVEWDARFLDLADRVSSWPRDWQDGGVGAVLVSPDRRRVSIGYSGGPRDWPLPLEPDHRDLLSLHAESNAIANAGCDLTGWTLYSSMSPCLACALQLHQHRVAAVVSHPIDQGSRWAEAQGQGEWFLRTAGMSVRVL